MIVIPMQVDFVVDGRFCGRCQVSLDAIVTSIAGPLEKGNELKEKSLQHENTRLYVKEVTV